MTLGIAYGCVTAAVIATAAGQFLYKLHFVRGGRRYLAVSMAVFVCAPILNFLALTTLDIGFVYMCTAFTHVLIIALSAAFLKESISLQQVGAAALIASGIVLYGL